MNSHSVGVLIVFMDDTTGIQFDVRIMHLCFRGAFKILHAVSVMGNL